jgi:hypothetical protein
VKALPGPTPTPRSSGGSGRAGVGSDLVVPLALFPGLPFVAALGLIYIEGGWTGVLLTLGALIAIVLVFAVHATEDSRRYKRTARGEVVELRVMWETPLNEHTAEGERR